MIINLFADKNKGCNHMTCRKAAGGCGHEFCWVCKRDWNKHRLYYKCDQIERKDPMEEFVFCFTTSGKISFISCAITPSCTPSFSTTTASA